MRKRTAELAIANTSLRREIEARRLAEENDALHRRELDHVTRLSILGEMASGIAHELNQPLAAIVNYAEGCQIRLRAGVVDAAALVDGTERIRQQAARAGQVIQRMRAFVRKRDPMRIRLNCVEVVRETVELFEGSARRAGVCIEVSCARELPQVMADRVQVQQVLLNLLQNALDATSGSPHGAALIQIDLAAHDGGVSIEVADNGSGLDENASKRLFEPFFTTKPSGLGLGLALCLSIAEAHGGSLTAANRACSGALLRLWLPAAKKGTKQ